MLDIVLIQVQLQLYETEENDVEIMGKGIRRKGIKE